jgi:hypothetical protein
MIPETPPNAGPEPVPLLRPRTRSGKCVNYARGRRTQLHVVTPFSGSLNAGSNAEATANHTDIGLAVMIASIGVANPHLLQLPHGRTSRSMLLSQRTSV